MQINAFYLKIIACLTMLADHIGFIFFPKILIFRVIGRLAFPIFAFLIAQGYKHTKHLQDYFFRLFIFLMISEPFYFLAFSPTSIEHINIFGTLFLGLLAIYLYEIIKNKKYAWLAVVMLSFLGNFLGVDYGFFGILLIFSFHFYDIKKDFYSLCLTQLLLIVIYLGYLYITYSILHMPGALTISWFLTQFMYLAVLPLVKCYNGQQGKIVNKYVFYAFYPLHIAVLIIIYACLSSWTAIST